MRPTDAIADGYDEITHINFVIMQAMPDSVVSKSNGLARIEGPGRYAKDVDLNAAPMKPLITTMAQHHTVVDPTLVVFETCWFPRTAICRAPTHRSSAPCRRRWSVVFDKVAFAVPTDLTRADYRASFAKLRELVAALHTAGVPIVAGTDGSGLELVRELELYVEAGFTTSEALASATSATARPRQRGRPHRLDRSR